MHPFLALVGRRRVAQSVQFIHIQYETRKWHHMTLEWMAVYHNSVVRRGRARREKAIVLHAIVLSNLRNRNTSTFYSTRLFHKVICQKGMEFKQPHSCTPAVHQSHVYSNV